MIEKHFTDDVEREGPDHGFSMDPKTWREMVDRTRELELAMGSGVKKVEANELETVVVQRRSVRLKHDMPMGATLSYEDLIPLRPCPTDAISPSRLSDIVGARLRKDMLAGDYLRERDLS